MMLYLAYLRLLCTFSTKKAQFFSILCQNWSSCPMSEGCLSVNTRGSLRRGGKTRGLIFFSQKRQAAPSESVINDMWNANSLCQWILFWWNCLTKNHQQLQPTRRQEEKNMFWSKWPPNIFFKNYALSIYFLSTSIYYLHFTYLPTSNPT